jgi:hypothetical protein
MLLLLSLAAWLVEAAGQGRSPAPPAALAALVSKTALGGPIEAWCQGQLRAGHPGGFAVAVSGPDGGRYVVLDADGAVFDLAAYTGRPEVSCYSRSEVRRLNDTLRRSQSVHGEVTPRWNTAVVCGFVEATSAVCWQHSPATRVFVRVGGWVT